MENLPIVKDAEGKPTDKVRSSVLLSKAIESMSFGLMIEKLVGRESSDTRNRCRNHSQRIKEIAEKFRAESRLRQQMMWRSGKTGRGETSVSWLI